MPTVPANGVDLYYEAYGDGPPVLFLHGAGMDGRLWAELARPLADEYRLVVPDLRGHGRSGGSDRPTYTVDLFAADLRAFVDGLGLDAPAVVGHSMGGFVALVYADRHADACSGLVTVGGEAPEPLSLGERIESHRPAVVDTLGSVVGRDRVKRLLRRVDAWRFDERGKGDPEAIERVHARHGDEVPEMDEAEGRKLDDALASYYDVSVEFASVGVPSLHLFGEYEIPQVRRHARFMADRIPNGAAREVPDAGHVSYVDSPGFVLDAIREVLGEAFPGRRG